MIPKWRRGGEDRYHSAPIGQVPAVHRKALRRCLRASPPVLPEGVIAITKLSSIKALVTALQVIQE